MTIETRTSATSATRLLIVDDDALITATLATALRQAGYEVAEVTSPEQALELCAAQRFDLAILDERMPNMTGTELAYALRDSHGIPVVFLSAYDDTQLVERTAEVGALGFFLKPIDPQRILPALHNILARARELRILRTREAQLQTALVNEREINTAVGVLMEQLHTTRENAFESLRRYARSQRQQVAKIAVDLLQSINATQQLIHAIGAHSTQDAGTRIKIKSKSDDASN